MHECTRWNSIGPIGGYGYGYGYGRYAYGRNFHETHTATTTWATSLASNCEQLHDQAPEPSGWAGGRKSPSGIFPGWRSFFHASDPCAFVFSVVLPPAPGATPRFVSLFYYLQFHLPDQRIQVIPASNEITTKGKPMYSVLFRPGRLVRIRSGTQLRSGVSSCSGVLKGNSIGWAVNCSDWW